jgi:hypothetical protein
LEKKPWRLATQSGAAVRPTLDWLSLILVVGAACPGKRQPRIIDNSRKTIFLATHGTIWGISNAIFRNFLLSQSSTAAAL